MDKISVTFVVGTGRCGSTLLSDMIACSPDALVLSEFFSTIGFGAFPNSHVSGREFWEMLAQPRSKYTAMLRAGLQPKEYLYLRNHIVPSGGIPPLMLVTLPFLTGQPELEFAAIQDEVMRYTRGAAQKQYFRVFAYLCRRFRRNVVVERSGASLRFVQSLIEHFPDSLVVHLYRDGRQCAVSMANHLAFRFNILLEAAVKEIGFDPYVKHGAMPKEMTHASRAVMPDSIDPEYIRHCEIPLHQFGSSWSRMVLDGLQSLATARAGRVHSLSYEALVRDPQRSLFGISDHIGLQNIDGWIERAALLPTVAARERQVPPVESVALTNACRPGLRALGYCD